MENKKKEKKKISAPTFGENRRTERPHLLDLGKKSSTLLVGLLLRRENGRRYQLSVCSLHTIKMNDIYSISI